MRSGIILFLCFLPLGVIYVVMKLSLLLSSSVDEINHIKEEAKKPHGPYIPNPYEDEEDELD